MISLFTLEHANPHLRGSFSPVLTIIPLDEGGPPTHPSHSAYGSPDPTNQQVKEVRSRPAWQQHRRLAERKSGMAYIYEIIVQGHLDADWFEESEG